MFVAFKCSKYSTSIFRNKKISLVPRTILPLCFRDRKTIIKFADCVNESEPYKLIDENDYYIFKMESYRDRRNKPFFVLKIGRWNDFFEQGDAYFNFYPNNSILKIQYKYFLVPGFIYEENGEFDIDSIKILSQPSQDITPKIPTSCSEPFTTRRNGIVCHIDIK